MSQGSPVEKLKKSCQLKLTMSSIANLVGGILVIGGILVFLRSQTPSCKRSTEVSIAVAIESAVDNFYHEYGRIPELGDRVTTDSSKGREFLTILLGREGESKTTQNLREIKFLSVKEGRNGRNGLIVDATGNVTEGLFDRCGNPYTVILDSNYDEQLHFDIAGKPVHLKHRRAAFFSPGADQKIGTSDDITTW